ncbi:hypothetical protein GCM10022280_18240 [Sphingomonas swuensis]|uniref:O-antigen ligase-related domain-containing protein n=1 Tax=Sphingomonas swuensis TaxID=977800 RepID=A0ABP7T021_9SPHN
MQRAARHLTIGSDPMAVRVPPAAVPARSGAGTVVALLAFVPVWMSRPLGSGNASLAFAIPFLVALWAVLRPAPPQAFGRALQGLQMEALAVGSVLVMASVSMLVSPDPFRAARILLPMAYAVCALIVMARVPPILRRRLVYALLFAGVLVLSASLLLSQSASGRALVMRDYRLRGFVENANQLGLMILCVWPVAVALLLNARTLRTRLLGVLAVGVLAAAMVLSGSKTGLALGFASGALTWLYHASRSGSIGKTMVTLTLASCALIVAVPILLYILSLASPITFAKIDTILTHGIWDYRSIQTRDEIWQESLRLGLANPLLGSGAGAKVLGVSHSHNLALDWFRGMGVIGLAAALLLTLAVLVRSAGFLVASWRRSAANRSIDVVTAAMFIGAAFYLLGNYLSDSLSPTTAFPFWLVYLAACLEARQRVVPASAPRWSNLGSAKGLPMQAPAARRGAA